MNEPRIYISALRGGRTAEECGHTMTAGELIEWLKGFEANALIYMKGNGSIGSITPKGFDWDGRAVKAEEDDVWDDEVPGIGEAAFCRLLVDKYGECALPVYDAVMEAMDTYRDTKVIRLALDEYDDRMFCGDVEALAEAAADLLEFTGDERYRLNTVQEG